MKKDNLAEEPQIGQKIKKIRELRSYTQEYMAEQLGMSQTGYGNIERGETDINLNRMKQISEILGIKIQELFGFDEKAALLVGTMTHNNTANGVVYNNENFERERKLYEEQVALLKDQVNMLKEEIIFLKKLIKE
jgi:transcriptional regulator with XRE-family HTH domain